MTVLVSQQCDAPIQRAFFLQFISQLLFQLYRFTFIEVRRVFSVKPITHTCRGVLPFPGRCLEDLVPPCLQLCPKAHRMEVRDQKCHGFLWGVSTHGSTHSLRVHCLSCDYFQCDFLKENLYSVNCIAIVRTDFFEFSNKSVNWWGSTQYYS